MTTPSQRVAEKLEARGFQRTGFVKAICQINEVEFDGDEPRIIPDAFFIAKARQMVVAAEVEDQSPLTWTKLGSYVWLWFSLDCEEWDLELALVSPNGVGHYVDLCAEYVRSLYDKERFNKRGRATPLLRRDVPPFYVERIRLPATPSSVAGQNVDAECQ